jgi:hypothetical protein
MFASGTVATGHISVCPVGQHQRPFELLSFTASVWNTIRPCQVAMNNKLGAPAQLQRLFSLASRSTMQVYKYKKRSWQRESGSYAALYRNAAWYKNTYKSYNSGGDPRTVTLKAEPNLHLFTYFKIVTMPVFAMQWQQWPQAKKSKFPGSQRSVVPSYFAVWSCLNILLLCVIGTVAQIGVAEPSRGLNKVWVYFNSN